MGHPRVLPGASGLGCAAAALLALGACRGGGADTVTRLSIATGGTGGVYYIYGGALARVLSRVIPQAEATAEVTSASVENLNFLADRTADIAFTLADTAEDAVRGRGRFPQPVPLRVLAALYDNYTHIVAEAGGPVRTVADLRGRRVSTGSPGSGTEVIAERVLGAAGLDPARHLARERLGVGESAAAFKDGKIDAFFFSGGLPTSGVAELFATPGRRPTLVSDADLVDTLVRAHGPLYATGAIPEGTYAGLGPVSVSTVRNLLVVHRDMPEPLAHAVTQALFAARDELAAAHPAASALDPSAAARSSLEYHPGAVRYYRGRKVWSER